MLNASPCICYRGNISSRFLHDSEANASELLVNLEDMYVKNGLVLHQRIGMIIWKQTHGVYMR